MTAKNSQINHNLVYYIPSQVMLLNWMINFKSLDDRILCHIYDLLS